MRKWVAILAVAVLLVIVAFALLRDAPKPVKFTLSDGTVVEVLKVTTGPHHRFRYDSRWQDYLGYVLPNSLRARLNPRILEYTATNASSLILWTKSQGLSVLSPGLEISMADKSDVEVPVGTMSESLLFMLSRALSSAQGSSVNMPLQPTRPITMTPSSNALIAGWLIESLPHHVREIGLGFHDRQGRVGYFKLPNPSYRRAQNVRLDVPPLVKSAGDVQVKLVSVEARNNPQNKLRVAWFVRAEVMRVGTTISDWQLDGLDVLADGEFFVQVPALLFQFPADRGSREPALPPFPGPWPDTAWTLRLWAAQRTNFASNEIWIVKDVPMTNGAEWKIERHERRQVDGKEVELLGFRGPEVEQPGTAGLGQSFSSRSGDDKPLCYVCFAAPPRTEGVRITFLGGHDDQGRTIDRANPTYGNYGKPWNIPPSAPGQPEVMIYGFMLRPAPDSKALTLEFAVHRARSVDFIVKPNRPGQSGTAASPKAP